MKLVLFPGLDGTGQLFSPLLKVLPPHYSPVVVSYPSHRTLAYAELSSYVRESLPSEEYLLIAESFSGPLAIGLTATHPPNLKALVLCATFVTNPSLFPQKLSLLVGRRAFCFEPPAFFIRRYLLGKDAPVSLIESFHQVIRAVAPEVLAHRVRSVLRVNVREALAKCSVPILYLAAKRDKLVKPRSVAEMRVLKPEIEVVEVDGPHFLLQRAPEECVAAIEGFASRVVRSI